MTDILKERMRAWHICARELGARPGESLYDAARRARYHGNERARASEMLLAIRAEWAAEQKWQQLLRAAELLHGRRRDES